MGSRRLLGALAAVALVAPLAARGDDGDGSRAPGAHAPAAIGAAAIERELPRRAPSPEPTPRPEVPVDSVSCGTANRGALSDARELPLTGRGYVVPDPWRSRGHRFGTDELVGMLQRAAARVDRELPGGVLAIADLSKERGGAVAGHRSHQSGRDVDLVYYALDDRGDPFPPDSRMATYGRDGRATYATSPTWERSIPTRYFDLARNWALVRAMLEDPEARVTRIFVSRRVKKWLLSFAINAGEPAELVARAERLLTKPEDAGGHNDHMHVRIACGEDDVVLGRCSDALARRRRRARWTTPVRCPAAPAMSVSDLR